MTAQSVESPGYDPDTILRLLPAEERDRFVHDYRSALDAAHEPWRYRQLQDVLQLWHLRAIALQRPDFWQRAEDARTGNSGGFVSAEQVIPGWGGPQLGEQ